MSKKKDYRLWLQGNDVYHFWAHQSQPEGKTKNVLFDGQVIYSFGKHFPIARIYTDSKNNKTVFFTTDEYSRTTSKHINHTYHACSHMDILYMQFVLEHDDLKFGEIGYYHSKNISSFRSHIMLQMVKFNSAKERKWFYLQQIRTYLNQLEKYITFFKLKSKIDSATKKLIAEAKSDKWEKELNAFENKKIERSADPKWAEKREKARLARERAEEKANIEQIEKWRNFKAYQPYLQYRRRRLSSQPTLLRYDSEKQRIETSQFVKVPLEIAHKFYRYIQIVLAKGGCTSEECCNYTLLDSYQVKEITNEHIVVGCHRIKQTEIELMAVKMNWI